MVVRCSTVVSDKTGNILHGIDHCVHFDPTFFLSVNEVATYSFKDIAKEADRCRINNLQMLHRELPRAAVRQKRAIFI